MKKNFILCADDIIPVVEYLEKKFDHQHRSEYYSKNNDLCTYEEYFNNLPCPPWGYLYDYKTEELHRLFVKYFFEKAKIDDWRKIKYVSLNQAIALTFGKNPNTIDWEILEKLQSVQIAVNMKNFRIKMLDTLFCDQEKIEFVKLLEWLSRNEFKSMDKKFIENVIEKRSDITDWEKEYHALKEQYDLILNENTMQKEELNSASETVHARSKNTYLGMFAGLLAVSYGAEDILNNEYKASQVNEDIFEKSGFDVTDEVVRNYIKEVRPILQKHLEESD